MSKVRNMIQREALPADLYHRVQTIEHKNQKIIYLDLSDLGSQSDQIIMLMNCFCELTLDLGSDHAYQLIQGAGASMNKQITAHAKGLAQVYIDNDIEITSAIVGITGLQRIIAKAVLPKIYFAKDMEDGLDWLADH